MKTQIAWLFLATALMLTACGEDSKKSSSVDDSMSCPQETVDAYNDIGTKSRWYEQKREIRYLVDVQNACTQFKSRIGSGSCLARGATTGSLISLSAETVAPLCNRADRLLSPDQPGNTAPAPGAPIPAPGPTPAPAPGTVKLSDLKNGFKIVIHDVTVINQLLAAGVNLLIQEGQVAASPAAVNPNKNYCYLSKKDPSLDVREGDVMIMSTPQFRGRQLTVASADLRAELGCAKGSPNTDWTLADLSRVFGPTAEILVNDPVTPN